MVDKKYNPKLLVVKQHGYNALLVKPSLKQH